MTMGLEEKVAAMQQVRREGDHYVVEGQIFLASAEAFIEVNDTKPGDNWLSYLPMAWVGDAAFSLGMALAGRLVANCPEGPESVQRDLRELERFRRGLVRLAAHSLCGGGALGVR